MAGVIRTRVGYAGGTKVKPTYTDLGDHTECVQIDYDPEKLTYDDLLKVFWSTHNPCYRPYSRQYASLILYHNDQQKEAALRTKQAEVDRRREKVHTEVLPLSRFYLAEDYHQKYYLQTKQVFKSHFRSLYPDLKDFVNSTAAARVNAYLASKGTKGDVHRVIDELGLSATARQQLLKTVEYLDDR